MFNLPALADWTTEDATTFDALTAELAADWRAAGLSWSALAGPACEVVDTADPAPWWPDRPCDPPADPACAIVAAPDADPGPMEAERRPTPWRRFCAARGVRTAGLALGVAACAAGLVAVGALYWSAWVLG